LAKKEQTTKQKQYEAYMENYRTLVQHLQFLSSFNVREFMGTREDGDPRVHYLAGLEGFKNLANAQLSGIIRFLDESKDGKKTDLFPIMAEELAAHVKSMEEDLGVTGWNEEGHPQFDLQILKEKTKGWPQ